MKVPFSFCVVGLKLWQFHESRLEAENWLSYNQSGKL